MRQQWLFNASYHTSDPWVVTESMKREGEDRLTGRDTLDTASTRETTDRGLGNTLDVVTEDLAVTLGAAFAEAFATFSACVGRMLARVS